MTKNVSVLAVGARPTGSSAEWYAAIPINTGFHVRFQELWDRFVESKTEGVEGNNGAQAGSQAAQRVAGLTATGQPVGHFQDSSVALPMKF